ncbi:hypothetical protein H4R33_000802 [Dimargaris cristalligena]|uniref:Uncharacterized protein n=1 Tax=Dimargaris cristalligena TaxID=215637 RepID=A0A4P9ZUK1_9FUNG|nr:hypothetical protein H4R33_000802 [Dimargaris cristalligena]RKP37225.1 hypothetical protein BJ085DRAFT_40863 [Dimargaris cristalligena]|eukprot:RKP37225.1 hypothetical protein BJ085DRAFT_40863 [Dimargaris cristalligena]
MYYHVNVVSSAVVTTAMFAGSALATSIPTDVPGTSQGMAFSTPMHLTRRAPLFLNWRSSQASMTPSTTDQAYSYLDNSASDSALYTETDSISSTSTRRRDRIAQRLPNKITGANKSVSERNSFQKWLSKSQSDLAGVSTVGSTDKPFTTSSSWSQSNEFKPPSIDDISLSENYHAPDDSRIGSDTVGQSGGNDLNWSNFFQGPHEDDDEDDGGDYNSYGFNRDFPDSTISTKNSEQNQVELTPEELKQEKRKRRSLKNQEELEKAAARYHHANMNDYDKPPIGYPLYAGHAETRSTSANVNQQTKESGAAILPDTPVPDLTNDDDNDDEFFDAEDGSTWPNYQSEAHDYSSKHPSLPGYNSPVLKNNRAANNYSPISEPGLTNHDDENTWYIDDP